MTTFLWLRLFSQAKLNPFHHLPTSKALDELGKQAQVMTMGCGSGAMGCRWGKRLHTAWRGSPCVQHEESQ
jgi:hypothetical protein